MAEASADSVVFDSGRQHLATVYAKALLGAAEQAGVLDLVLEETTSLVQDVLKQRPAFEAVLSSPRIDAEEKIRILDKAFRGKMTPVLLNSLKVMARHGRLDCLRALAVAVRKLFNEASGRIEVKVRTAQPLDAKLLQIIKDRLRQRLGKEVDLQTEVRPEILGGLVVKVGDTLFDGSLVTRLEKMRVEAIRDTVKTLRGASDRFALSQ